MSKFSQKMISVEYQRITTTWISEKREQTRNSDGLLQFLVEAYESVFFQSQLSYIITAKETSLTSESHAVCIAQLRDISAASLALNIRSNYSETGDSETVLGN